MATTIKNQNANHYLSLRNGVFASLLLILIVLMSSATRADTDTQDSTENLLIHFVEAFNSGNFETMSAFYQQGASASFNERRTEQESRDLHQQLTALLGTLTFRQIEVLGPQNVRLVVDASISGSPAEFRFNLVGDPPNIDGFSVGVPPVDSEEKESSGTGAEADHVMQGDMVNDDLFGFLTSAKGVFQTQVVVQSDGSLLLVWVQKGLYGLDLFVARQLQDGVFSRPMRINQHYLNSFTGDEARPSVAVNPDGAVAVAWTAANADIMLAVGSNYGQAFEPPVKLNQDEGKAYRTMPAVALSPDGAAHTVWLDPREAPKGMEEPSDLYYATVKNAAVSEYNLTARQESTVCGCCRPYIEIDDQSQVDIVFRNASDTGYRDISRINGNIGSLSEPQPTSPPVWKLNGCPSAGPIVSQGGTLWKDASTGSWRMLWSTKASVQPSVLFSGRDDLELTYSPRTVSGREAWVLIGAKPYGLIATWNGESWQIIRDDLPPWVSSAAVNDGQLIFIGNQKGRLKTGIQAL